MSDFFKKFLLEDPRRLSPGGRYVGLAAFGKHPGWDDHVEDLGLESESLNFAKTVLYVKGIGGQIDSGAWEKLDAAQQLPAFDHLFVWQRAGQILVGRLWSSSDGKGRTRYPMVICLHFAGVTLSWALKRALSPLAELAEKCVQTTSAVEVRDLLDRKRAALREACQSTDLRGEYAFVSPEALHKILRPSSEAKREDFLRVLYQIQSQMGAFAPGKFNGLANPAVIRAQQIRVPAAGENAEQALLFWSRFFLTQVDASVPLLLTLPLEAGWVDVTAGEPESQEFFCLRASPKAVPMVSEVPYTLDEAFRAKAAAFLDGFLKGETTAVDLQPAAAVASVGDAKAPGTRSWRKWLGAGAIVIIGAVASMLWLPKGGEQQAKVDASDAGPKVLKVAAKPEVAASASAAADPAKAEAARVKAQMDARPEAVRLAKGTEATTQKDLPEQRFQTAMKEGKAAFERKDYAQAILQAGAALETKANAPLATKLLTDAQDQLDLANKAKEQDQKYEEAMNKGKAAFGRKEYAEAIFQAGAALETKPNAPLATKLRTDAQEQLDLVKKAKEQDEKYEAAMVKGKGAFDRKEYAEAIFQAGVALDTKVNDAVATKLLTDAQGRLDLANKVKEQDRKYAAAMNKGKAAFGRKEYAEVISQAVVALETKANDPDATKLKTEAQQQLDLLNTAKAQEQQRQAAEAEAAKKKADEQAKAKADLTAAAAAKVADPKTADAPPPSAPSVRGEITNSIGMVLVPLPSGIWVGKYEVTQAEYRKVMNDNPSKSLNDRQPVEQVSWKDARKFCSRLTEMERSKWPAGQVYNLPSEKQWKEFLGGQRFEDLPDRGLTGKEAPAVAGESGPANKYGLFDVLGNVWEWCLDDNDGRKVLMGGAFNNSNFSVTLLADKSSPSCGFRCILAAK